MKKTFIALIMTLLLCGCTQNNGNIGPIYGSWSLISLSENDEPVELEDETVFSFQNEIVQVVKLAVPPYNATYRYGNFSIVDNILTLKFQEKPTEKDSHLFLTPTWLHFPQDGRPIQFDISSLKGNKMILDMRANGKSYTYTLKRTW